MKLFLFPFKLYSLLTWLVDPIQPKWKMYNAYPTTWMLLLFVMLHSHFFGHITEAYWKNIIAIDIEKHALSTAEEWFPPKPGKPPDPIRRVVTMHLESLEGNCVDKSSQSFTYEINASTIYRVSQSNFTKRKGALIDSGANGSLAGSDVRVISQMNDRKVNVEGIDNHQLTDIPLVTAAGVITTQKGTIIAIMNQYAHIN